VTSFRVRFLPEDRQMTVEEGVNLLEAAREANVYVGGLCSSEGVCGKCRVIIREGEVDGESTDFLTREEIRCGYVLACQVVPRSDLVVEVPAESRLAGYQASARTVNGFAISPIAVPSVHRANLIRWCKSFFWTFPSPRWTTPRPIRSGCSKRYPSVTPSPCKWV